MHKKNIIADKQLKLQCFINLDLMHKTHKLEISGV